MELALMLARIGFLFMSSPEGIRLAQMFLGQGKRPEDITWDDCYALSAQEIRAQGRAELAGAAHAEQEAHQEGT